MPNVGDVQVYNGSAYVPQQYVQGQWGVGLSAAPTHRFDMSDGANLNTYFTSTPNPRSGGVGWVTNKVKSSGAAHTVEWRVGGESTWGMGQDYDTNNSGNDGFGNSDFVLAFDYTANAVNAQQSVSTGGATGGTFTLSFTYPTGNTQTTGAIQWNATAAAVESALVALSNVGQDGQGRDNVSVTGSASGPWTVTFQHALRALPLPAMTFTSSLTGGTGMQITVLQSGSGGADIFRISPAETSSVGTGSKFVMGSIVGTPRDQTEFLRLEAGDGLSGLTVKFKDDGGTLSALNLTNRSTAVQRCILNWQNSWQTGVDYQNTNVPDFYVVDSADGKTRLVVKGDNSINPKVAFGTANPPNAITTHAISTDSTMLNKQQVGIYVGYNNTLNDRGIYAVQVVDATTDVRYLFLGGGFDDGTGTRANPKFKSTATATWALMGQDALFSLQTAPIGSNQTPVTGLSMDTSGHIGVGLTSMTAALHLKAGAAGAGSAPLKFTAGTSLTTAEAGTVEYDGNRLFSTPGPSTRRAVALSSDHLTSTSTVVNSSSDVTVFTGTIAANEMAVGKTFSARILGRYSTANATDTFTVRCKVGSTMITELTITSTPKLVSNTPMELEFIFTCRTTGSTGTVRPHARATFDHVDVSQAATGDTTIDTTAAQNATITVQWSRADANDSINIGQGFMAVLN